MPRPVKGRIRKIKFWVVDLVSRRVYNLDTVERFVLGTVGEPGERAFYIQAKKAGQNFTFALEKAQAQALTDRVSEILKDARSAHGSASKDFEPLNSPIESEFTLGVMAITWQFDSQLIRFEGQAITDDNSEEVFEEIVGDEVGNAPAIVRITLTPSQVRSFIHRANSVIKAGRQPCMFCGGPINIEGHICPRAN
jgi:uncharacterized repeat protein (TIGR03847 family)